MTHVACGYKHAYGVEDGDVMGCVADIGWAVGHGVNFYGNLLNGGTALLFESLPNFPDPGRGSIVYRLKTKATTRQRFIHSRSFLMVDKVGRRSSVDP